MADLTTADTGSIIPSTQGATITAPSGETNTKTPLFQLRTDADSDDLGAALPRLVRQTQTIQSCLFILVSEKRNILQHFEDIVELVAQAESNLEQMMQIADELDSRQLCEVLPNE